ncbi:protein kinase [Nonomuraea sp. NPDC049309]|uniref:serine/threonine-protein kinase n=1 Tax=Nonomuraea sp. NPDC049309 TaxID=3364350 RepID=UPI0037248BE7
MLPVEDAPGYRVLDQVGQGGFAVVYRAYQERLDRVVALKVLSVDRVDQRTMRRFQRELQLTGRLTGHPNVVTVFDTGMTASGKPYIAMDFFENGSLRDRIRKEGPLPVPDVLRTGVKLAGALAAVHEAGVLHGDIKPQNILISRYGEPAIADFGVARVVDAAEISATSQAFTPLHAAPEVLTGQPHSAATDVYSLGSTLYHLLAGQPAFHNPADPSIAPLMYRVLNADPPPINRPDVPPAVLAPVLRAMAKQPEARYGSARELARHLQAVQAELGLPVTDLIGIGTASPASLSGTAFPATGPQHSVPSGTGPQHSAPSGTGSQYVIPSGTGAHHAAPSGTEPHHSTGAGAFPATGHQAQTGAAAATSGAFPATGQYLPPPQPPMAGPPAQGASPMQGPPAVQGPPPAQGSPSLPAPPPQPSQPATNPGGSSARTRTIALIAAAVAVIAAGGTALAVFLSQPPDRPRTATPTAATGTQRPEGGQDVAAYAPREVKLTADQGALIELTWKLPAAARRHPVVIQSSPGGKGKQTVTAVGQGATSAKVTGLDPDSGYCFLVGVPVTISENSAVAWSEPYCIRGAVARSAE